MISFANFVTEVHHAYLSKTRFSRTEGRGVGLSSPWPLRELVKEMSSVVSTHEVPIWVVNLSPSFAGPSKSTPPKKKKKHFLVKHFSHCITMQTQKEKSPSPRRKIAASTITILFGTSQQFCVGNSYLRGNFFCFQ
jgi:hypothetical protein